jgi:WD40 repeat protein
MRYLPGHTGFVQGLDFSPGGRFLASASADKSVRVWRLASAEQQWNLPTGEDWAGAVAFSPDDETLCVGSHDGRVSRWNLMFTTPTGEVAFSPSSGLFWDRQGRITGIDFSPRGERIAWSSYKGFTVTNLKPEQLPQSYTNPIPLLYALSFSPDGLALATGGNGPEVFLHNPKTGAVLGQYAHADPQGCWDLAFSPNGRTLALALGGGLQLWDVGGQLRAQVRDHENVVSGVVFSPDGRLLLTCSWDQTAILYEFEPVRGRILRTIDSYNWRLGRLYDVAISPDGALAAVGGNESPYLVVWDVE